MEIAHGPCPEVAKIVEDGQQRMLSAFGISAIFANPVVVESTMGPGKYRATHSATNLQ
jgi:hypothetical protein